jgi:hypothetical protein
VDERKAAWREQGLQHDDLQRYPIMDFAALGCALAYGDVPRDASLMVALLDRGPESQGHTTRRTIAGTQIELRSGQPISYKFVFCPLCGDDVECIDAWHVICECDSERVKVGGKRCGRALVHRMRQCMREQQAVFAAGDRDGIDGAMYREFMTAIEALEDACNVADADRLQREYVANPYRRITPLVIGQVSVGSTQDRKESLSRDGSIRFVPDTNPMRIMPTPLLIDVSNGTKSPLCEVFCLNEERERAAICRATEKVYDEIVETEFGERVDDARIAAIAGGPDGRGWQLDRGDFSHLTFANTFDATSTRDEILRLAQRLARGQSYHIVSGCPRNRRCHRAPLRRAILTMARHVADRKDLPPPDVRVRVKQAGTVGERRSRPRSDEAAKRYIALRLISGMPPIVPAAARTLLTRDSEMSANEILCAPFSEMLYLCRTAVNVFLEVAYSNPIPGSATREVGDDVVGPKLSSAESIAQREARMQKIVAARARYFQDITNEKQHEPKHTRRLGPAMIERLAAERQPMMPDASTKIVPWHRKGPRVTLASLLGVRQYGSEEMLSRDVLVLRHEPSIASSKQPVPINYLTQNARFTYGGIFSKAVEIPEHDVYGDTIGTLTASISVMQQMVGSYPELNARWHEWLLACRRLNAHDDVAQCSFWEKTMQSFNRFARLEGVNEEERPLRSLPYWMKFVHDEQCIDGFDWLLWKMKGRVRRLSEASDSEDSAQEHDDELASLNSSIEQLQTNRACPDYCERKMMAVWRVQHDHPRLERSGCQECCMDGQPSRPFVVKIVGHDDGAMGDEDETAVLSEEGLSNPFGACSAESTTAFEWWLDLNDTPTIDVHGIHGADGAPFFSDACKPEDDGFLSRDFLAVACNRVETCKSYTLWLKCDHCGSPQHETCYLHALAVAMRRLACEGDYVPCQTCTDQDDDEVESSRARGASPERAAIPYAVSDCGDNGHDGDANELAAGDDADAAPAPKRKRFRGKTKSSHDDRLSRQRGRQWASAGLTLWR